VPQFRKKPVVVDAITFDALVEHARANSVSGTPWSFSYAGHAITHENDDCYLIPTLEGTMRLERGDMLITGVKGEIYPCKADIFAATYDPVTMPPASYTSTFQGALAALKDGRRVARAGWNGKGMFAYMVPAASYPVQTGAAKAHFGDGSLVPYNAYFALKGVDETVSTWVPSVSDLLAEDWHVIE
jgi:hypothetical protein